MTLRATTLGVLLLVLGVAWVRYAALITFGANIDNSVPSGPALLALLVLIGLDRLLQWLRRRRVLEAREIAVAYSACPSIHWATPWPRAMAICCGPRSSRCGW